MHSINIRKIRKEDDAAIAAIIRTVLKEHRAPETGTAFADKELDAMTETYSKPDTVYFVVELDGKVAGGAGIAPLAGHGENVCELQKMYFIPEARGLGIGHIMLEKCLLEARNMGFRKCYLETLDDMLSAQSLYRKSGFTYLEAPLGNTGHNACPVWMIRDLA